MKQQLLEFLQTIAVKNGIEPTAVKIDYPENPEHGDFSTNLAMVSAKKLKLSPKILAEKILADCKEYLPHFLTSAEIADPGFINFKVKPEIFAREIVVISNGRAQPKPDQGKKIMVEYTDPNTFKVFHIGHLMTNAIGESISRLIEITGSKVIRICYPSDIGLHIAKSIWALKYNLKDIPSDHAPITIRTDFLGKMYVLGTNAYDTDPNAKQEIDGLNKIIYEKSDPTINSIYEKGRNWSLEHFELIYKILGTKFDETIYESQMAPIGLDIVKKYLQKGIFELSDGATIFNGEKFGCNTRVFINSKGLPTYEAKDMGLNTTKFKTHPDADQSIILTGSEQNDYFKVIIKALYIIDQNAGSKTRHIGHGTLRFASGKMSSRTGNVVTAETLIADIKGLVMEKIAGREFTATEADEIAETVAIAAIKYTILRTSIGSDVIFDSAASISFEGDSGPYLQYSAVRAASVLAKAGDIEVLADEDFEDKSASEKLGIKIPKNVGILEKLIARFPDITARAREEYAPQNIAGYLTNLAAAFNGFYAVQVIVSDTDPLSPYYVSLTKAFLATMVNGLWILGIKVPKKM